MSNNKGNSKGGFQLWHLVNFFFGLIWPGMFYVLAQTYIMEITGSAADAGLVMGIIGLGALAAPVFGGLADRYRAHRPIQILAFSIAAVGIFIMGFAENEMFFMLAAILVGVGLSPGIMINNVYALASGLSKEAEAASVASLQRMMFIGQIVGGFAIAGLLQSGLSFKVLFAINAGVALICMLLAVFGARSVAARVAEVAAKRVEKANADAPAGKFSLGDIFKSTFGLVLLAIFLNHLGWTGIVGQYTNFFKGAFGIDPSVTSSVNSIAVLLSLVVIGFAGKWMGKSGPLPVASVGMALRVVLALALAAIGWALGGVSGALVLPLLVWTAFRLVNPLIELANPVLAARTAVGGATQAQALMTAAFALAIALGNFLNGQLAENFGWMALPWQTVVFCTLAFLVTHFGIRPRLKEGSNEPDPEMLLIAIEMDE